MTPWINKPVPFNIGQGAAVAAAPPVTSTFTWSQCISTSGETLKPTDGGQAFGAQINASNAMIGSVLDSLDLHLNRRGTNSSNNVYVKYYPSTATDPVTDTALATSDTFAVSSLTTGGYPGTTVTFTFSSPPTISTDDFFLVETDMPYASDGSPELFTVGQDCTDYTKLAKWHDASLQFLTDSDIVGTAEYTG